MSEDQKKDTRRMHFIQLAPRDKTCQRPIPKGAEIFGVCIEQGQLSIMCSVNGSSSGVEQMTFHILEKNDLFPEDKSHKDILGTAVMPDSGKCLSVIPA